MSETKRTPGHVTDHYLAGPNYIDAATPEESKKYVAKAIDRGEPGAKFFLVLCQKPDGPADLCHTGNGPTSEANARRIAVLWSYADGLTNEEAAECLSAALVRSRRSPVTP